MMQKQINQENRPIYLFLLNCLYYAIICFIFGFANDGFAIIVTLLALASSIILTSIYCFYEIFRKEIYPLILLPVFFALTVVALGFFHGYSVYFFLIPMGIKFILIIRKIIKDFTKLKS